MNVNDAAASAWSGAEQFDPMGAAADQDFGSLIDFDHLDLDFSIDYSAANGNEHDSSQQLTELADSLDVQHLQNQFSPAISHPHEHRNGAAGLSQDQQNAMGGSHGMSPAGSNAFYDFTMSAYAPANAPPFSQAQDQMYRQHVPPTPNSSELHGEPGRYLHHMDPQQALYDQRYQLRKEDAVWTSQQLSRNQTTDCITDIHPARLACCYSSRGTLPNARVLISSRSLF
jgi:hypothetical protein